MIFLVGYYGFGNVGDEAVLSTMLAEFRARRPNARIVVASGDPARTTAAHGVEAVAWNDMAAIHRAVQVCDLVLIGGGGLFHDYWGIDPDTFLTDGHWGIAYYAGPALLAALYGKRLMLYAVGVGPLHSAHGMRLTRLAAQAAHAITVRDAGSRAILESIGIPGNRVRITDDPGFAFHPSTVSDLPSALPRGFPLKRPVLGAALRHWSVGVHPDFLERELASALDIFLDRTGGSVVLVPFQNLSGERENDRATATRILEQMRLRERAAITDGQATPDRAYAALQQCDAVLGMRLHALIFAAAAGVPAVPLSYDPTIDGIVGQLGLAPFACDVKSVHASHLATELVEALSRTRESRDFTTQVAGRLRNAAAANVSMALDLLDAPAAAIDLGRESFDLLARGLFAGSQFARRWQESLEEAARAAARFAEDREWLQSENKLAEQEKHSLSEKLAEVTALHRSSEEALARNLAQFAEERDALNRQLAEVSQTAREHHARLDEAASRMKALEAAAAERQHAADQFAARLRQADEARAFVQGEIDLYRSRFQADLAAYHLQRAWQVMLLCRKAYILFQRSKARFLAWAMGLPFLRTGSLAEFDLTFPDIANYVPATFRRSWLDIATDIRTPAAAVPSPADAARPAIDTPPQRDRYDVIILAIIDFDFRFQRPQQIAAEFARRGHRVFWISPTRFLPVDSPDPYKVLPLRENLWEIHLRSRQPDIYMGELQPDVIAAMSEAFDHLYRDWTIGEHALLAQLPFWRRLALEFRARHGSKLLYDCMDDWDTFENMGKFNVTEEKDLVRETDILVVTGAELERKYQAQGLKPVLARNGADFPFFSQARSNGLLGEVPKPVVGYFGAIADWIDLDLVYEVAQSRPQYSFVMIGQVFGRDISHLESLPNVRMLGSKPYADIPAYLYHFDACTIPFLINQVTKATDPVKLYEYFSLGKPVVATDMAELGQCGDLVYIGRDPEDFARKLDLAVSEENPDLPRRRIEFARANTWSSRVDDIDRAIREAFPPVSILIVTYNSAAFVGPCLESVLRNTSYPSYEVIVVDNASTDNTVERVKEYVARDSRLRLIALPKNLGFAGGNNHAARESRGERLIFLNVDTMVTSGWIERLLCHMRQDPSIGLLCPVTNFAGNEIKINVDYTDWRSMERFARNVSAAKLGQRMEIGVAPLYCALMPRAVWDRIGEMDTRYEIGMFEDDDLSLRIRQAGLGVFAAEDCFIHHFGQGSFSKLASETYNRIFEENRRRFEEKWKQPWAAHCTRPGVRPAFEETRFDPVEFTR
jgi:polysaccharide pyruvyl transferase CsaB